MRNDHRTTPGQNETRFWLLPFNLQELSTRLYYFSVILTYTHLSNGSIALVSWTCLNSKWEFKWDLRKVDGLFFSSLFHALPIKGVLCFWKTNYAKCWGRGGDKRHCCLSPCSGHWDDCGVPYICHQTFKPHNNSKRECNGRDRSFLMNCHILEEVQSGANFLPNHFRTLSDK